MTTQTAESETTETSQPLDLDEVQGFGADPFGEEDEGAVLKDALDPQAATEKKAAEASPPAKPSKSAEDQKAEALVAKQANDAKARAGLVRARQQHTEAQTAQIVAEIAKLLGKGATAMGETEQAAEAEALSEKALASVTQAEYRGRIEEAVEFLAAQNEGHDGKPLFADLNKAPELREAYAVGEEAQKRGDASGYLQAALMVANVYIEKLREQGRAIPVDREKAHKEGFDEGFAAAKKQYRVGDMSGGRAAATRGRDDGDTAEDFFARALEKKGLFS